MKPFTRTLRWLFTLVLLAGCAQTNITERQSNIGNEKLARSGQIIVYDLAATPADVPADNAELKTMVEGFQVTDHGLRQLGSGELDSGGSKTPGMLVPLAVVAATANPIGLIVGGAVKLYGEGSGSDTIEGSAKRTADAIAKQLRGAFQKQQWI